MTHYLNIFLVLIILFELQSCSFPFRSKENSIVSYDLDFERIDKNRFSVTLGGSVHTIKTTYSVFGDSTETKTIGDFTTLHFDFTRYILTVSDTTIVKVSSTMEQIVILNPGKVEFFISEKGKSKIENNSFKFIINLKNGSYFLSTAETWN